MSSTHLLKSQARCLVASYTDDGPHEFLVGSANLRGPNELRLLRYYDDDDEIESAAVFNHPGEVVSLATTSAHPELVATVGSEGGKATGAVWRMPVVPASSGQAGYRSSAPVLDLEQLCTLPRGPSNPQHVAWCPAPLGDGGDGAAAAPDGSADQLLSLDDSTAQVWRLRPGTGSTSAPASVATLQLASASFIGGCAWDPHRASEVAIACDSSILCWDLRTGERPRGVTHAVPAGSCVRSLSYNPNKPWHLASGGDDYRVKIWDARKTAAPVKILDGHTHWVTSVAFNPCHDQLVLSGGSDARVNLWRVSSVSSAPLLELGDEEVDPATGKKNEPKLAPDACVRAVDDHDDSVLAAVWSARDAWVHASLSFAGKVVVCQVPAAEKYKILL